MDNEGYIIVFALAVLIVVVIFGIVFMLSGILYRNTEIAYCDCTITGKVQDKDDNIVSVGCERGPLQVAKGLSDLEWQALEIGNSVVVVETRTDLVDNTTYSIVFSHPDCAN